MVRPGSTVRRSRVWGAAIGIAAIVASACSSAGDDTEASAPAATQTPAGGTGAPPAATTVSPTAAGTGAATSVPPASIAPTTTVPRLSDAVAASPEALAAQLQSVEQTIRDDAAPAAAVVEAGRLQQLIYRSFRDQPALADAVVAALPDDLSPAAAHNLAAERALAEAAARRTRPWPATLPAWAIRDPKPIEELRAYYADAEAATGVPWHLLAAINLVETRMGRIDGVSSAGAIGPMQFLPSTWAACCTGDPLDDRDAIIGAATFLAHAGAGTDVREALHDYNPSDTYVEAVSRYSETLRLDERAYRGYHAWQVFVTTTAGTIRLPVGYVAHEPIDAAAYHAAHPEDLA